MRIVFENAHGGFSRVEARSAAFQNVVTCSQSALETGAIISLFFRRHLAAVHRSGAAVDRYSKFLYFHVWLILGTLFFCGCKRLSRFLGERSESLWDCTKEQQSKEAIGSKSFRASHETAM